MVKNIRWDRQASNSLDQAIFYIESRSPQGADRVKKSLVRHLKMLARRSDLFELDRFKQNNDGTYRYFVVYRIRISYRVLPDEIYILRVRHCSQDPIIY